MRLQIKVKYFDKDIPKLEKLAVGDWIDLRAAEDVNMSAGEYAEIPLGVAMQLPKGYEALIASRSSTFKKWGIKQTNPPGVIDESYSGDNDQWKFACYAYRDTKITKGERICHFRIQKKMPEVEFIEVESLNNKDRGGFGNTGTR